MASASPGCSASVCRAKDQFALIEIPLDLIENSDQAVGILIRLIMEAIR